jgi:hypothetical protein
MLKKKPDKKTIFIHIPKTGGTSISLNLRKTKEFIKLPHKHSGIKDVENYEDINTFAFVRNPYDRLVSAFFWTIRYREEFALNKEKFSFLEECDFNFEKFVLEILPRAETKRRVVFKPMHKYICDNKLNILVKHVGKFEYYNEHKKKIFKKLGLKNKEVEKRYVGKHKDYKEYSQDGRGQQGIRTLCLVIIRKKRRSALFSYSIYLL